MQWCLQASEVRSASMTAQTAPQPERQVRAQGGYHQMIRYGIVLAAVARALLSDRRFHVTVITGAIGVLALADVIKNNQARPVRRAASWYWRIDDSQTLAGQAQSLHKGRMAIRSSLR
jgi:hypothetical protein